MQVRDCSEPIPMGEEDMSFPDEVVEIYSGEEVSDALFRKIDRAGNRMARKKLCLKEDVPWGAYQEWVSRTKRQKNKSRRTQWTELRKFKEEREGLIEI